MQIPSLPLFANINENEWNYLREHNMLKLSSYAKNKKGFKERLVIFYTKTPFTNHGRQHRRCSS